ncbi:IGS10 protein, partial [Vireo altiloquus]|nr:IGS10 protein [Vireo altiloquus]
EDGRVAVLRSGTLTLRTADVFDTGLYHCTCSSRAAAAALPFRITVLDPRVEHDGVNGARLLAALGSTLHLPCTSTAAPDAALTWVLPEGTILRQSAGNKHIFANGTLRIRGVTERDVGYFRCVAANRYGVDLLVFQVLLRQDETALKEKHGAVGEWEEGSGNELLHSAVAQRHPSAAAATPTAQGPSAASAASSQGTCSAPRRNGHGKMPHWPYGDRTGRRFRGHRRQFVSSGRRVDPQRWAALLEKTKRNVTATDKREVATEPPIQVHKLPEVPEDGEETSGDLISPEEEFLIPATERSPVPALGRATELAITAGPEETTDPTAARNASLLLTEPLTPLPSPLPHSVAPGSKRPQIYPDPTGSWERSDLSQIPANGFKQSTVSSRTFESINYGESNNQHLKSAPMTPTTEATGTAATPQSTANKLHIFTESTDKVSTKTDHQVPVATVKAPSSEFGPIYFHNTQKGGTPKPPLASTLAAHQQIRVIQDIPTHPPQLQQHYGRQRKISGRRRFVRPGRISSMKEHRYNFGRPGSARGSTAVATGVQLDMNYVSNAPTLDNLSSSINPFSPEAPWSPPSTMNTPLEHPVGAHQNTAFLREEENKRSARQKAATTGMSVTAKDTATTASSGLGATGLKPTITLAITPQTDTRVTKSKIFRAGGRRGQRKKRPPKAAAPRRVAAAPSTVATAAASTATGTAAESTATGTAAESTTTATAAASTATATAAESTATGTAAASTATATAAASTATGTAAASTATGTAAESTATATAAASTAMATAAASTATVTATAATSPAVAPSLTPAKPLPGSVNAVSTSKPAALWIPDTPEAPRHRPTAATETSAPLGTWGNTQAAASLPGSLTAQSSTVAPHTTPATQRSTQLATSPPASSAQTPTKGLQTSPWLDEPPGATSAQPPAVRTTSEPVPAQHIRATATAGEKSHLKMGEGVIQENQAAQATFTARTMSSAPAAVTAPSTQHPSPLP